MLHTSSFPYHFLCKKRNKDIETQHLFFNKKPAKRKTHTHLKSSILNLINLHESNYISIPFLWMVCLKIDSALKKCGSSCNVKTFLLHFVTVPPLVIRFIHMRNPPPRTGKSASRCGLEPFVAARRTTRQQSGRRQGRLEANLCKAWQGSKALPCKGGRCGRREMFKHMIYIYIYIWCFQK